MKFYIYIQKTPLFLAVELENQEIIQLLLAQKKLDINLKTVLNHTFFMK